MADSLDLRFVADAMLDLTQAEPAWGHLFLPEHEDLGDLMDTIDRVNGRFGKRPVVFGAEGTRRHDTETGPAWAMRR
jgi:hypothetical protein